MTLDKTFQYALGIDCGAGNIRLALVRSDGKIIHLFRGKSNISGIHRGIETRLNNIQKLFDEVCSTPEFKEINIFGVGIGISGQISRDGKLIGHNGPRYPDMDPIDLIGGMKRIFGGHKVEIDNDSKAATLGEFMFGAGKGKSNMVHFTLGTGVGGGIIVDKQLVHGELGIAGHLGFISVDKDGPRCVSGMIGCVEYYSSGTGIANRGKQLVKETPDSLMEKKIGGDIDLLSSPIIFSAAKEGDPLALKVINEAASYLGMSITTCLHAVNPEIVTLGGGLAERGQMFIEQVRESVKKYAMKKYRDTPIVIAKMGDNAGVLGAAAMTGFTEEK